MRRLQSESKQPGMHGNRHCLDCGALLPPDQCERCIECRPILSQQARAVGEARRQEREAIEQAERQIESLEVMIRRIKRKLDQ